MKKICIIISLFLLPIIAIAQDSSDFDSFLYEQLNDFDKFIDDANRDFINFMRNPWKEFKSEKPIEKRSKPEPVTPIVYDNKHLPSTDSIPSTLTIKEILDLTSSESKQKPIVKIEEPNKLIIEKPTPVTPSKPPVLPSPTKPLENTPLGLKEDKLPSQQKQQPVIKETPVKKSSPLYDGDRNRIKITYGGNTYYVTALSSISRNGTSENAIADAYESLFHTDYNNLISDCNKIKDELQLNDWGLFKLIEHVADNLNRDKNTSIIMQQFILNEMGYKARMARKANADKLLLFVASDIQIYGHPYITQGKTNYYYLNDNESCSFYMCQRDAPTAKNALDMRISNTPLFKGASTPSTHQAKGSSTSVTLSVPQELMEFYSSYPQCDYGVYINAPVNKAVADKLKSSLTPTIHGKSESQAANLLINFVQTAFQYATDGAQFGYEKPFFVEECFYYPQCDCEDRSILFSYLVRTLLNLNVVLLEYPNHIATAVCFNEDVTGDHININGNKYIICDPTYIGAPIGKVMPQFKNVSAKVLKY